MMNAPDEFEEFRARSYSGGSLMCPQRIIQQRKNSEGCQPAKFSDLRHTTDESCLNDHFDRLSLESIKSFEYHADESDTDSLDLISHCSFEHCERNTRECVPTNPWGSPLISRSYDKKKTIQGCLVGGRSGYITASNPKCIYMLGNNSAKSLQKVCSNINWDWNVKAEEEFFLGEMRPRVSSMPTKPSKRFRTQCWKLSQARAQMDRKKVRSFSISKTGMVKEESAELVSVASSGSVLSIDSGTTSNMSTPPLQRQILRVVVSGDQHVGKRTMIKAFSASTGPDLVYSSFGKIIQFHQSLWLYLYIGSILSFRYILHGLVSRRTIQKCYIDINICCRCNYIIVCYLYIERVNLAVC